MYAPPQTPPDAEARAEAAAKPAAAAHATVQPPALPPVIRCAYDLSCFSYLLVAAALWAHGARGTIPGRMLAFMLPAQAAISFLADSVEFLSRGSGGKWQAIDRVWAACTFVVAVVFVRGLGQQAAAAAAVAAGDGASMPALGGGGGGVAAPEDLKLFWLGLGAGTAAWVAGVVLLRVTTAPVTWALCHITWHVVPAMAGANLLLRGASISTGQHISL